MSPPFFGALRVSRPKSFRFWMSASLNYNFVALLLQEAAQQEVLRHKRFYELLLLATIRSISKWSGKFAINWKIIQVLHMLRG